MSKQKKEVRKKDIANLAAKEADKAVKELQGVSDPSDDGIRTRQRNI